MSFLLTCPNCGAREVTDFGFGGEVLSRPKQRPTFRELNAYNYFRANRAGRQREWWFHRAGCRAWFIACRDTSTNHVAWTALPGEEPREDSPPAARGDPLAASGDQPAASGDQPAASGDQPAGASVSDAPAPPPPRDQRATAATREAASG